MALLCNHGLPTDANDSDDRLRQPGLAGGYRSLWWNPNECLFIKDEGYTELWNKDGTLQPNPEINWFNDVITSVKLREGYRVTLFQHQRGSGLSVVLPNVGGKAGSGGQFFNLEDYGFSDTTSSILLVDQARLDKVAADAQSTLDKAKLIVNAPVTTPPAPPPSGPSPEEIKAATDAAVLKAECETIVDIGNIDKITLFPRCNIHKDRLIKEKCTGDPSVFGSISCMGDCATDIIDKTKSCLGYCKNLTDEGCIKSFKEYCGINENKDKCLNFCNKTENNDACQTVIINTCKDKEIITNTFCQNTASLVDNTNYVKVMSEYCNTDEGKTKELCNCYNTEKINTYFSDIKKPYLKNALASIPVCSYDQCKNIPTAYKISNDNCNIDVCAEDIYDVRKFYNFSNSGLTFKNKDPTHIDCFVPETELAATELAATELAATELAATELESESSATATESESESQVPAPAPAPESEIDKIINKILKLLENDIIFYTSIGVLILFLIIIIYFSTRKKNIPYQHQQYVQNQV
jgi:hypothetical protein